jgi:transcriptional regulator with XRE-family HTH domain
LNNNLFLRLRLQRGLTQEELSERSGISIRTIRKFERGLIERPRRSSVDMLLAVLDPDLEHLRTAPVDELGLPPGMAAEWLPLVDPGVWKWRGSRPPRTSLIAREREVEQLGELVIAQRAVVVTGPGGVGKSRVALAAAESIGRMFSHGVAVAEMGRIPGEQQLDSQSVMELAVAAVDGLFTGEAPPHGRHVLLILDNTEHLARTTALLVDRLLNDQPALHILITSRRPPVLHGARIWELALPSCEAAMELLVDRLQTSCPTLDLSDESTRMAELVRRLDRLPRFVEFAAHRLRIMPLSALLSDHHAMRLLGSADFATLPHQQTMEANILWSLDLLDERHQGLLACLAHRPDSVSFGVGEPGEGEFAHPEAMELLADLADFSLLQVDRGRRYEYRMFRHIQAVMTDGPEPVGAGTAREWAAG